MSNQITNSTSADDPVSYVSNPEAARLIAALIQTGYFPSSIPECMTGYWPLALAEIQAVADQGERQRFQAFSAFTVDLSKEQSWGMMFEVRTFLLPKVNRTEKDRQLFWAKDAMSPPPELEWVVPGLFARPSLNLLVGDPGSKKTYLAMDLAVCVANGIPWLDHPSRSERIVNGHSPVDSPTRCEATQSMHAPPDSAEGGTSMLLSEESDLQETDQAGLGAQCQVLQSKTAPSINEGGETPPLPEHNSPFIIQNSQFEISSPIPVLFIDEESGYLQMWSRFNSVLHAHNSDLGAPLAYTSLAGYKLNDQEDTDALIKRALSIKAGLIIIDALSDLLSTSDSTASIQPVLFNLRRLADTCHAAVLVIHHTNREGGYRGSSSIAASVDLMLEVTSPPTESLIEIRTLKSRFQAPDPFHALAHFTTTQAGEPRFNLSATETPANLDSPALRSNATHLSCSAGEVSGVRGAIMQFLVSNPNSTRAKITTGLPQYSEGTIRNTLLELRGSGMVLINEETINDKSPEYLLSQEGIEAKAETEGVDVQT